VIECIRSVTDKPISHVVLTHYHAVRVLGASAYGASEVIMSEAARGGRRTRGRKIGTANSAASRACFRGMSRNSGPDLADHHVQRGKMTVYLGKRKVDIMHLGRAHTAGDAVIWVPDART
jgi:glyoxylase-like metal-dependent hydrolase (beta-lactamase superfamily II)